MDDHTTDLRSPALRETRPAPKSSRRGLGFYLILLVVVLALAAGLGWIIFHPRPTATPSRSRFSGDGAMPIVAANVEKGDIPVVLNELGTVTPLAMVTVRTQISGQLMRVGFQEGQDVNKGDFLAEIDPRPYQAALDQFQGQLLKDQALLKNAQIDLARFQKLVEQNSIAVQQRDTQEYLVRQYEGTVKSDQAQVDNAKLNLAYCHIVAPVSGRVGLRQVDPGNYVQTSDPNGLVVLAQIKPISVIFTIPQDSLPAVAKRFAGGTKLTVTAFDRDQTTKLATGFLLTLDNQIDTSTGTVKLRAQFDNADEVLFPNQFVNVQLLVDSLHGVTIVPTAAIQRGAPGTFVYVLKPDDTVGVQVVKVGPSDGERVAILNGLAPGDKVVVDGTDKLKDGAKVSVSPADGGAKPQTPAAPAKRPSTTP